MLGLYDSGLGGLTVLAALRAARIDQDVIYFADQAHVPYGERTDADLYALMTENFALLDAHGVDAIVMACNTSCAVAARLGGFPPVRAQVLDLIVNAAAAMRSAPFKRIAVIATAATVRSEAYRRAIARSAPQIDVVEIAAPAFVPLVEAGATQTRQAREAVAAVCDRLPDGIDALVYGCTHFPALDDHFALLLDARIARVDPAVAQAAASAALIERLELPPGAGRTRYLTNSDVAAFEGNVRRWTGDLTGEVTAAAALAAGRWPLTQCPG